MREDFQYAFRVLNTVAFSDGIFGRGGKLDNWSNGLDHCGWFRVEMADFLRGIGIDSPDCCSESWRPELESTEQKVVDEEHEIKNSTVFGTSTPQTKLMLLAQQVHKEFWDTFDPDAPGAKRPTQNEIIQWLMEKKYLAEVEAKAVEKVACPLDRNPKGGEVSRGRRKWEEAHAGREACFSPTHFGPVGPPPKPASDFPGAPPFTPRVQDKKPCAPVAF